MSRRQALATIAICLVAACFSPDIMEGVPCGPLGECPSGFECRGGRCSSALVTGADAPLGGDAAALADAPAVDASNIDAVTSTPPPDASRFDAGPSGTLTINFLGTGGGTVMAGGSSCTSDCPLLLPLGNVVALTPSAAEGSIFAGWGGACSGTGACSVTIGATPQTVAATFNVAANVVQLEVAIDGPGTVTLNPLGQSCGPGCLAYAPNTTVVLTPVPTSGFSIIGWGGSACEARGPEPCTVVLAADTSVTARFCKANRVVDAALGADGNAGTCIAPYRTLGKALSLSVTGQIVQARPGLYSTAIGESFPLLVPDGVTVLGDEPQKGAGTVQTEIRGGGPVSGSTRRAAVVLGARAVLAGFLVVNDAGISGSSGVIATRASPGSADSVVVRNNSVQRCTADGIALERAPNARVTGNVVVQNGVSGVRITGDAPGARLEDNVVVDNGYGVEVDAAADLGGGGGSAGGNILACNAEVDLRISTPNAPVTADDNGWDHVPPTSTPGCGSGFDICTAGATVSTDGAVQAPACI